MRVRRRRQVVSGARGRRFDLSGARSGFNSMRPVACRGHRGRGGVFSGVCRVSGLASWLRRGYAPGGTAVREGLTDEQALERVLADFPCARTTKATIGKCRRMPRNAGGEVPTAARPPGPVCGLQTLKKPGPPAPRWRRRLTSPSREPASSGALPGRRLSRSPLSRRPGKAETVIMLGRKTGKGCARVRSGPDC